MKLSGWRGLAGWLIFLVGFFGCTLLPSAAEPPLTVAAAQRTLDTWNPSYCKVAEFYGLFKPGNAGATQVAYVTVVNPGDKAQKPAAYAAQFQLLTRPNGRQQWFLTSLVTHSSGYLSKRQGWDYLMIPVEEAPPQPQPAPAKK